MNHMSPEMQRCIENCQDCHAMCLHIATSHGLKVDGEHITPDHIKLMAACAEMCKTSADFMLIGTPLHKLTCGVCAQVCEQCAADFESLGDMDDCAQACRACAASCRVTAA